MGDKSNRQVRIVLLLLVLLAAATTEVVSTPPGQSPLLAVSIALGATVLVGMLGRFERPRAGELVPSRLGMPLLIGALILPWPIEFLRREMSGDFRALEVLMVEALRNTAVVLMAFAAWPICLRLSGLASLFVVLFAGALAEEQPAVPWLLAGFVSVGTYWLVLIHWTGLRPALDDRHGNSIRLPWPALAAVFLLLGVFLAAGAAGPRRAARVLMELVPTAGGTGDYDPAARGGINDGDDEISGENAQSSGFVETDVFIEDDKPSLYDAVSDLYGKPFRPKNQDLAIALDPRQMSANKHPSENLGARREFPTTRRKPANARKPLDRDTDALFFVLGRTPLHLRMAVYDRFDGVIWYEAMRMNQACCLEGEPDGPWMRLAELRRPEIDAGSECHELRFAHLKSNRFPTPPHLFAFRLGKVNRISFFSWVHPGVLRIRRQAIPAGVCLHTESHMPDPELLAGLQFPTAQPDTVESAPGTYQTDPRVRELARRWAGDARPGWKQIENVVTSLRRHAEPDREAVLPEGCRDAVAHFLLQSRRGPDYLFASALAIQLRSLGYVTRVVSGFYARPDRFDAVTQQTPVHSQDVHFWTEVLAPGSVWVVLEPTPGYEVLAPQPSLFGRVASAVKAMGGWLAEHAVAASGMGCLAVVLFLMRRRLLDWIGVLLWKGRSRKGWRAATLGALWLLERRSRWAGRPRPAGCAPVRWSRCLLPDRSEVLLQVANLADWAAHAPAAHGPPCPVEQAQALCRQALREWTIGRFRKSLKENR